jgi:Holliday junction DNA helicase RuvA
VIASLRGIVLSNSNGTVVLEVGGVGYSISVVSNSRQSFAIGEEVFFHTAFIVREDAHLLFGFETSDELMVFDLLRSVTGVGPKSAQAVLAAMTLNDISAAVVNDNDAAFRKVSGIGPKTAKLITVSLSGKLGGPGQQLKSGKSSDAEAEDNAVVAAQRALAEASAAVVEALLGLGYNERVVTPIVDEVARELKTANRNELLRAALNRLGSAKAISGGDDK